MKWHTHKRHHQPLQKMLHTFNAHTRMHATKTTDSHQIPHIKHGQQAKIIKQTTIGISHLYKYNQHSLNNESQNVLNKFTRITYIKGLSNTSQYMSH